jgi:hypothetical protein
MAARARDPAPGEQRRHHLHEAVLQRAFNALVNGNGTCGG